MNILVIDAQGGGIGRQLVSAVKKAFPEETVTAVGTNADAMLGEITPAMALAAGQSPAKRILLPIAHCDNMVVGTRELGMGQLVQEAVERLRSVLAGWEK